jgi:hypothetical protein
VKEAIESPEPEVKHVPLDFGRMGKRAIVVYADDQEDVWCEGTVTAMSECGLFAKIQRGRWFNNSVWAHVKDIRFVA